MCIKMFLVRINRGRLGAVVCEGTGQGWSLPRVTIRDNGLMEGRLHPPSLTSHRIPSVDPACSEALLQRPVAGRGSW